jgi:hypothetical protein
MNYLGLVGTNDMLSGTVRDQMGEEYGRIKELLVEPSSGRIVMAVLAYGGILGMGDHTKLIPWTALQLNPNTHDYVITLDRKLMETAPELDVKDTSDRKLLSELFKHYGHPAYWDENVTYDAEDPVYKEAKANTHQQYEGSYQISDERRNPESNNRFTEDVDIDKLEGRNRPAGKE